MPRKKYVISLIVRMLLLPLVAAGQTPGDSTQQPLSLDACIRYALQNQPLYRQSLLDQEINERIVRSEMAAWLPQLRAEYNLQHNLKLPVAFLPDLTNPDGPRRPVTLGLKNTSNILFQAEQVLYSNDVVLATRAARYSRLQASQNTQNNAIDLTVAVSKAFYDILLTQEQLEAVEEDIVRLQKLLKDAYSQYESGVTDKIDYKRATVSLNNANAQRKSIGESLQAKSVYLKQLTGLPGDQAVTLAFDSTAMEQTVRIDTLQAVTYENRIEFQLLETEKQLRTLNLKYYQLGFLPTASAFINYNFVYQNNSFPDLYSRNFPNSVAGVRVAVPLFQGTRRLQNLQRSRLELRRLDLGVAHLKAQINTEYSQALANYKSNLNEWKVQEENLQIGREVYNTVKLQYDEGIKTYLEVITSETDLRTAQINYLNALYNLLSSKLDVQRAAGTLEINR